MNTNNVPEVANQYLQEILKWNETLLGLPALPLVLIGCLAVGMIVKIIPWISNRWYSTVVLLFAVVCNLLITPLNTAAQGVRAFILAIVVTVASVIIDRKWLGKFVSMKDEEPTTPKVPVWLLIGALSFGAIAPVSFTGCAWLKPSTVAVGSDPAVVGAEQLAKLSVAYTGEFLKWEWLNRASLPKEITALADKIRGEFPKDYAALRAATKAYKVNRTPENKGSLITAQAVISALLEQVRLRLPAAESSIAEATAKTITN